MDQARVVCAFSRLHPLINQQPWLEGLGESVDVGPTVSIDLTKPSDEHWRDYRELHRRSIKKLRRQRVVVEQDAHLRSIDDFIMMYHETMERVGAAPEYFFPRDYLASWLAYPHPLAHLFIARLEETPISAAMLTACDGIAQYYLGGTANDFTRIGPNKLVIDFLREWAIAQGAHTLHLGGGVGAQEDSLYHFKCGFSHRRHRFAVWRWIVNEDRYRRLCEERRQANQRAGLRETSTGFFPQYRAPLEAQPSPEERPVLVPVVDL